MRGTIRTGLLTTATSRVTGGGVCGITFNRQAALGRLFICLTSYLSRRNCGCRLSPIFKSFHDNSMERSLTSVSGTGHSLKCTPSFEVGRNVGRAVP